MKILLTSLVFFLCSSSYAQKKHVIAEVLSSKVIYDADFKPSYKIQLKNNSNISIIGYGVDVFFSKKGSSKRSCSFIVQKKNAILPGKIIWLTGRIPQFDEICGFENIQAKLSRLVLADGTMLNEIQILLNSKHL